MQGFFEGIGARDTVAVMRAVDRLDKVSRDDVRRLLTGDAGLEDKQADACLELAGIVTSDTSFVERVRALGVTHPLLEQGLEELAAVVAGAAGAATETFTVTADLRIARGLDYYTGTVFETRMSGYESLGSVCSGGRYDALASDGRTAYPGVGISLGVTRLLAPLIARGAVDGSRSVPSAVLVALPSEEDRPRARQIAGALRARGIATELAPTPAKFGKQIRFADRRGIPYVWFPGEPDSVKDIRSGDQVEADTASWMPAVDDLRPTIVPRTPPPPGETQ
jgi:histidyl-tRNA synthetase